MELSIIIVNYNVKYFLEQCLCSVERAVHAAGAAAEIFVVDNHSSDGSAQWLPGRFPTVQFILNDDNKGFGAANNQALARAKGEYFLFLNPDTILPEDCLSICLDFMRSTPRAGAAGVRMIDGSGQFLKESRRGYPSPWVAFCKLAGLAAIFPRSPLFAGYYLGGIAPVNNHPSPILSGACMFVKRQALDRTGGFDERFFLYAEDIDLSYRIEQAGYTNYFIASTTILHFKGESTPRDAAYIKYFYKAMSQFRRKHSGSLGSRLFNAVMEPAIWLRAGLQRILAHDMPDRPQHRMHPVAVCGDAQGSERVKLTLAGLSGPDGPIVTDAGSAEEIIFCEGPDFSFKEIIGSIDRQTAAAAYKDKAFKIHAKGSAAAVGSVSRRRQGEVIKI